MMFDKQKRLADVTAPVILRACAPLVGRMLFLRRAGQQANLKKQIAIIWYSTKFVDGIAQPG